MSGQIPALPPAKIPSLARRLTIGIILLLPLLTFWVALPYSVLSVLESHGVSSEITLLAVVLGGGTLSILGVARYVAKPTRAFGPIALAASVATVSYLLYLGSRATLTIPVSHGASITLGYAPVLDLLAIAPAIGAVAALVTTFEDAVRAGERLPFDFPV